MNLSLTQIESNLYIAQIVSLKSKDPRVKVGAVILNSQFNIESYGYNGFPKGIKDTEDRWNNKELKRKLVLHAEENAILCSMKSLIGCSLFVFPIPPCHVCARMIIQSGISNVYSPPCIKDNWKESCNLAANLMEEVGIKQFIYENTTLYLYKDYIKCQGL